MNTKKVLTGILIILVIAIAGIVVYFAVGKKAQNEPEFFQKAKIPIMETLTPNPTDFPTNRMENLKTFHSEQYNFEFMYPDNFVIGKYKEEDIEAFPNAVVLVEKLLLGNILATEIPIGEISTITIQPHIGQEAQFYGTFNREEYRISVGKYEVAKLPSYPGPYGDTAFYYVLVTDDMVIDFTAHKDKFNAVTSGTYTGLLSHYDQIIEKIISTFVFNK